MLSALSLNNVALIKKQNIDWSDGFNCLLGQSGAGKSIVIDALSFSLGAKAEKNLIRTGETSLRVDAVFSDLSEEQKQLLSEYEIEAEDELIITRTLTTEGKSSIKINGFPATLKMLKELAEGLVDFCGQHDSVGLLNVNNHLALLDKFAGKPVEDLKQKVSHSFDELKEIESQIKSLGGNELERARTKDLLQYQIQELENANLRIGEEEELKERLEFISSAENIFERVGDALLKLDEQRDNATSLLYEAKTDLSSLSNFSDIEDCKARLESCYYDLKDVAETLKDIKRNTEFDPKELEILDARLDQIKSLTKKYGKTVENLIDYLQECKQTLDQLENSQFILEELNDKKLKADESLQSDCKKLSAERKKYAKLFQEQIMKQLSDLEMQGADFYVDFQESVISRKGFDAVKFMFSANKGQEVKDLHKTASGGELSRILLAFKNVMLDKDRVETVVFDEIDAGISGRTAGKVAEKLANISKFTQIICITHTPVVASKANNFLLVEKNVVDNSTISTVKTLKEEGVVREIARLIDGGTEVSETALQHSRNLLQEK
ncbi:MAG: DNA repair protein RecN [Clostridiales bacterium]|nr:DNA repair protein RecN [Clostridiales bacterium]